MGSANDPYLVGILYFDSLAEIKEAFATECGQACAADRRILAPDDKDVQMFLFDDQDTQSATNE